MQMKKRNRPWFLPKLYWCSFYAEKNPDIKGKKINDRKDESKRNIEIKWKGRKWLETEKERIKRKREKEK